MAAYALMWSGGKDSALALSRARASGLEVSLLLNFIDPQSRRVRFHATRAELVAAQAEALGLPLRQLAVAWEGFEAVLTGELSRLAEHGLAGVVFGDIHLADVRAWYEQRVRAAGLGHLEPIWGESPASLLEEYVAGGGRAVVTCVEARHLDPSWLGRVTDPGFVSDIKRLPVDPCGENGEYHTFAFAGPGFSRPLEWVPGERRDSEAGFHQLDLLAARCAHCGQPVDPQRYGVCAVCEQPVLCLDCARGHLCTDQCSARGCRAGLCVREVRDGLPAVAYGVS